jgi:midasin
VADNTISSNPAGVRDYKKIIDKAPRGNSAPAAPTTASPADSVKISKQQTAAPAASPQPAVAAPSAPAAQAAPAAAQAPGVPKNIVQEGETRPLQQSDLVIEATPSQEETGVEHLENYVPDLEKSKLVETPTTVENLGWLGRSLRLNENVLMVGQTGVGKTSLVKYLAALTNNELRRINLSDMTDNTELIGGYKPSKDGGFEWQDGIITEALRKGQWLLLDEINLADPAILERLNSLLDDDRFITLTEKNNEVVKAHPNTRIFATMNPTSYSGRKELSEAMLNRFHRTYQDPYPPEELVQILDGTTKNKIDKTMLMQMVMTHNAIADLADHRQIGKRDGPYPYTVRDLLKWADRISKLEGTKPMDQLIADEGADIYLDRLKTPADKESVLKIMQLNLKKAPTMDVPAMIEKPDAETLKIGDNTIKVNSEGGPFVPGEDANLVPVPTTMKTLDKIARCVMMDEPMLMVGPTAAGKTSMVRYMAKNTNNNFRRFNLEHQTDVSEFIGGWIPKPGGKPGEFSWKDGILVDAMKKGDWVVFDEINLAQPAILERINSLLDKDRTITLTEKNNEVVHAHPNFRVFATMNPAQYAGRKELSLAMRNRFTETWVDNISSKDEYNTIIGTWMKPLGAEAQKVTEKMVDFHQALVAKIDNRDIAAGVREGKVFTIRNLKYWSKFIKEFQGEEGLGNAFYNGIKHCYANQFADAKDREAVMQLARNYLPAPLKTDGQAGA